MQKPSHLVSAIGTLSLASGIRVTSLRNSSLFLPDCVSADCDAVIRTVLPVLKLEYSQYTFVE